MKIQIITGITITLFCLYICKVESCSCIPPELTASYHRADALFIGRITGFYFSSHFTQDNFFIHYIARVQQSFKGCDLQPGNRVIIKTAVSSASCGLPLQVGGLYFIEAFVEEQGFNSFILARPQILPIFTTNLCTYTRLSTELTPEELAFLGSRQICCATRASTRCICADLSSPFNCLISPCESITSEECPARLLNCTDNYCGGCNAEFFLESFHFDEATQQFYQEGQLVNCSTKCKEALLLSTQCIQDSDCVADIDGTSACACDSRNLVINKRFSEDEFLELWQACGGERNTPCDCPEYDEQSPYICDNGFCSWNYI